VFADSRARAAHNRVFFDSDKQAVSAREFGDEFSVEGFYKTHIGHGGIEGFGCGKRRCCEAAEGEESDVFTLAPNNAFADY
jgi:hypothetical protein